MGEYSLYFCRNNNYGYLCATAVPNIELRTLLLFSQPCEVKTLPLPTEDEIDSEDIKTSA